jgi:phosphoenolpyruvate carboxylase
VTPGSVTSLDDMFRRWNVTVHGIAAGLRNTG